MAGEIEENVEVHASADGFEETAAEVEELEGALHGVRDAAAEAGAAVAEAGTEGAAGMDALAASAADAKHELDEVRDASAENTAAASAEAAATAGLAAARKEAAAQGVRLRDSRGRFAGGGGDRYRDAGREIDGIGASRDSKGSLPKDPGQESRYTELEKELGTYRSEAEKASQATRDLGRDMRTSGLSGAESWTAGREGIDEAAAAIERARKTYAEAAPYIDRSGEAIEESGRHADVAREAFENWRGALHDFASGNGDAHTAIRASRELDGVLGDFGRTTDDATRGLGDLAGGLEGASGGGGLFSSIGGLEGFGGAFGQAGGAGQSAAMPAAIIGIGSAITTIGPALAATGIGFGSWAALAAPALKQVETGLTNVTAARQSYQKASALEQVDPTAAHAKSEQAALQSLNAAYAQMPANVRPGVKAIESLGHAWSEAGKKSGIQAAALKDIPKAAKDIKGLIPTVESLAKTTNPLVGGMLGDIGKFEKSAGFKGFVNNIKSEIPGAVGPLKQLGGALGSVATALFSKSNVKTGDQFISSIAGLTKEFGPGAVKSLGAVAKNISTISSDMTALGKSQGGHDIGKAFSFLGDANSFAWKKVPGLAATGWEKTTQGASSVWDKLLGIKPQAPTENIRAQSTEGARALLAKPGGQQQPSAKIKVEAEGAAKAKSEIQGAVNAGKGKHTTKIDVTVAGADKAKSDLKGVTSAAQQAGRTKADLRIQVSGAQAAVSNLHQVGQAGTAMGSGVSAGAGHATSATSSMAGSMKGAVAPLPADFRIAGIQAGAGMAAGISSETGAVSAAAHSLAEAAVSAANTHLIIQSPSKKFKVIGENTALGYILGLEGGKAAVQKAMRTVLGVPAQNSTITSTISKLKAALTKAMEHGDINPYIRNSLSDGLDADNKRLQGLAAQRAKLLNQISAAEQLAKSVQQAAVQGANLSDIAAATPAGQLAAQQQQMAQSQGGTQFTPGSGPQTIQQGLKQQLSQIQAFRAQIVKLKKDGLDKRGITDLLNAGVQSGGAAATQMLSGGKAAIKQIAQLDNSIGLASKKLGITGGNAAFEGAGQIGGQLAAGLKASLKGVNAEMASIAKSLVTGIMTALGDSSKQIKAALAKLDKELGISTGSGSASSSGGGSKITAPHKIYHPKPEQGPWRQPGPIRAPQPVTVMHPAVFSGATGGAAQPINITIDVTTNLDGKQVARIVQTRTLQRARRNNASGLVLAGHGT